MAEISRQDEIAYRKVKDAVEVLKRCKNKKEAEAKFAGSEMLHAVRLFAGYIRLPNG